jgi:hypothetical protein
MVNPTAGLVMALRAVVVIRGGKKPFSLLFTSKMAEALGVEVPILTCAKENILDKRTIIANFFFIL